MTHTSAGQDRRAELWLRGLGSRKDTARYRLFVFPHAGAGGSAYQLADHLPAEIEVCGVQLPGRENRFAEEPLVSAGAVADELVPLIASRDPLPFAFLGHSMGALLAFAVARGLRARGGPLPRGMFLSAFRAPHLADEEELHTLPDEELLARLGQAELAGLDPALQELLLPVMRADLTICETYGYLREEPLPCPFTVLGGAEDGTVTKAELSAWREHTSAEFELRMFPGGHLYLRDVEQQIAEAVTRTLAGRR